MTSWLTEPSHGDAILFRPFVACICSCGHVEFDTTQHSADEWCMMQKWVHKYRQGWTCGRCGIKHEVQLRLQKAWTEAVVDTLEREERFEELPFEFVLTCENCGWKARNKPIPDDRMQLDCGFCGHTTIADSWEAATLVQNVE